MLILELLWSGFSRFLSAAFTFLTTKPGVYLLMAGLAAGAYWYSGHEGYKRGVAFQKQADAIEFATLTANAGALTNGLNACNAGVDAVAKARKALEAAAQQLIDQRKREAAQYQSNIAAIQAIKSTGEKCPVAESILTRGFQ